MIQFCARFILDISKCEGCIQSSRSPYFIQENYFILLVMFSVFWKINLLYWMKLLNHKINFKALTAALNCTIIIIFKYRISVFGQSSIPKIMNMY